MQRNFVAEKYPVSEEFRDFIHDLQVLLSCELDVSLVQTALTHKSYATENGVESYERLEFLGDAVLEFAITKELFTRYPDVQEGVLTPARARIVTKKSLAQASRRLGTPTVLRLGEGKIQETGRENENILEDVMESLIGAVFLSSGEEVVNRFILHLFEDQLSDSTALKTAFDKKGALFTLAFENGFGEPIYEYTSTGETPNIAHQAVITFTKSSLFSAKATALTKKQASQDAAKIAIKKIHSFLKK